jgi:periplasmic protein TonB
LWTVAIEHETVKDIIKITMVEMPSGKKGSGGEQGRPAVHRFISSHTAAPSKNIPEKLQDVNKIEPPQDIHQLSHANEEIKSVATSNNSRGAVSSLSGTGSGQGSSEGPGNGPGGGTGAGGSDLHGSGKGLAKSDLSAYHAAIRARIEAAKQYPIAARRRHLEGNVVVSFRLNRDGKLLSIQISHSSGTELLDDAALGAVQNGSPYPRCPGEESAEPEPMTVNIEFMLK